MKKILLFAAALVCAATMWAERSFVDFKIEFRDDPFTVILPNNGELPSGVTVSGTLYNGVQHGVQGGTIVVPVDGPVKFTIGSCDFSNGKITVKKGSDVYAEIDNHQACGEKKPHYDQNVTWTYNDTLPATLTFELGSSVFVPYFFAQATEYVPSVVVSYYDTDTTLIANDTIPGASPLVYKYGASDVKVAAGKAFRGWFASPDATAKKVAEGTEMTANISLYARATDIEVAAPLATFRYDLTKDYFYPEDHELITITNGHWYNGQHGWLIGVDGSLSIEVGGNAIVTLTLCQYNNPATLICQTDSGETYEEFTLPVETDGDTRTVNYDACEPTTLTFTANAAFYIHAIEVKHKLGGCGTPGSPYRITSAEEWRAFTDEKNHEDYWRDDASISLEADIEVSTMAGTSEHPFQGAFKGNGHTLTCNINSTSTGDAQDDRGVAPFHFIQYARIENLRVDGTINSASKYTSGLVGYAVGEIIGDIGSNTIDGCVITATINQKCDYAGGIVGNGKTSATTVKNSIFAGTINGVSSKRAHIGGIVGWCDEDAQIRIQDCLENGTYNDIKSMHPMGLIEDRGSISDCYYINPQIGNPEQVCTLSGYKRAYTEAPETPMFKQIELIDKNIYWLSSTSHARRVYLYTGEAVQLSYSVTDDKDNTLTENTDYTVRILDSLGNEVARANLIDEGDYQLAFAAAGACAGSDTLAFTISSNKVKVTSETALMEDNIYEVDSNVTISSRITISGDVDLYLNEGDTLTAGMGILLSHGNKLTIYGPGTLIANGGAENNIAMPGIGAYHFGTLVINGGNIIAEGSDRLWDGAAGIGGEVHNTGGGSITINGGLVYATGTRGAAGIGGGSNDWEGDYGVPMDEIIINGGQVIAVGSIPAYEQYPFPIGKGAGNSPSLTNGTLTLSWTNEDDYISAGAIGGFDNIVLLKTFIDSNNVLHTPENPNMDDFGGELKPYIEPGPEGLEITNANAKAAKLLRNGVLYIVRDGKLYTAQGVEVR